jgi:hypothetical protein
VTIQLSPGPAATPADRHYARTTQDAVRQELTRVRASALAWRNGVAALLAGLLGFGLIKGRSDIGELASPFDVLVGLLLFGALLTGTVAALLLLRAAHGRPATTRIAEAQRSPIGLEHAEALSAARALRSGLVSNNGMSFAPVARS